MDKISRERGGGGRRRLEAREVAASWLPPCSVPWTGSGPSGRFIASWDHMAVGVGVYGPGDASGRWGRAHVLLVGVLEHMGGPGDAVAFA